MNVERRLAMPGMATTRGFNRVSNVADALCIGRAGRCHTQSGVHGWPPLCTDRGDVERVAMTFFESDVPCLPRAYAIGLPVVGNDAGFGYWVLPL
jgi:hypothetical protein